jgi:adenylate cyclase
MAVLVFQAPSGPCRVRLTGPMTLGRSPECDVVLEDVSVSRRHASLTLAGGNRWTLKDLGARMGTFVNGSRVENTVLKTGDELKLGNMTLKFEEDSVADAPLMATGPTVIPPEISRGLALEAELRQARALLSLHETFLRCSSVSMLFQGVGRDLASALRCERAAIFCRESLEPAWRVDFVYGTQSLPSHWTQVLERGRVQGAFIEVVSGAEKRVMVVASLGGGETDAVWVAELPAGRALDPAARELGRALCSQISGAVRHLALQRKTRRDEILRANLSRYLSEQVAQAVLEGRLDLKLGGQRKQVSVLFVDVRGFTRLSEQLPPESILQILNAHFGKVVPIIKAAQGTVDKFIGDALMAVFGAPNELPDHPLRAVRAAMEIQKAAVALAAELSQTVLSGASGHEAFGVGVGVNTGLAVAGNLGTEDRREFAVIGDAVNVASRLCANAQAGEVLVGPQTAEAIKGQVKLAQAVPIKVKGREQPVLTYKVM